MGSIATPTPLNPAYVAALLKGVIYEQMQDKIADQITLSKPTLAALVAAAKPKLSAGKLTVATRLQAVKTGAFYSHYDVRTFETLNEPTFAEYAFGEFDHCAQISWTELKEMGFVVSDTAPQSLSKDGFQIIFDLFREKFEDKWSQFGVGLEETLHQAVMLDGTQDAKAFPGLDHFISLTPAVGVVGTIDRAANVAWRNYALTGINGSSNSDALVREVRKMVRHLGRTARSDVTKLKFFAGADMYDALAEYAQARSERNTTTGEQFAFQFLDGELKIGKHTVELDHSYETLDAVDAPAIPWAKRLYALNTQDIHLRYQPGRGEGTGLSGATPGSRADLFAVMNPTRPNNQYVHQQQATFTGYMAAASLNTSGVLAIA